MGAGVHGGALVPGGSGTRSTNAPSAATPATPSAIAPQLLACLQEPRLVGRSPEREHPDVLGEVDGRGVDPQRPAQPERGPVQELTEARNQVEPAADHIACLLDQESAVGVQEPPAVEDDQRTDVL
jgi:hypothetical protein